MWFTCGFEHIDHAIKDDDMAIGISARAGRYTALCGATVNVASLICPPGRRCPSCEDAALQVARDTPARLPAFPTQADSRGRQRADSASSQTGYRLFSRLTSRGSRGG